MLHSGPLKKKNVTLWAVLMYINQLMVVVSKPPEGIFPFITILDVFKISLSNPNLNFKTLKDEI